MVLEMIRVVMLGWRWILAVLRATAGFAIPCYSDNECTKKKGNGDFPANSKQYGYDGDNDYYHARPSMSISLAQGWRTGALA